MLDGKFTGGNNTLCLVPDVEQNLVAVDFHNGSFDEVSVVEEFEGFLDLCQEVIGAADVVDCDLLWTGGRLRSHKFTDNGFLLGRTTHVVCIRTR